MLVLSRKTNESIVISGGIAITIVDIRGGKVWLGVEAPQEIAVHRQEIHETVRRQNDHLLPLSGSDAARGALGSGRIIMGRIVLHLVVLGLWLAIVATTLAAGMNQR